MLGGLAINKMTIIYPILEYFAWLKYHLILPEDPEVLSISDY